MRLLVLSLLAALVVGMRYDGYRVVEFTPKTEGQVAALESLFQDTEIIVYDAVRKVYQGRRQQLLVPPNRQDVYDSLHAANIYFTIINDDYQHHVDEVRERAKNRRDYDENDFNTLEDIYAQMNQMAEECPPQWECHLWSMTTTAEGRAVLAFQIEPQNPEGYILVDGGSHGREYIAVSSVMKLLEYIHAGEDHELMSRWGWVIIPVFNPDGYEYCWTDDRNWRKNRRDNDAGPDCVGVELNKNFDWEWGQEGGSQDPCHETYFGPSAASEQEVIALQEYIEELVLDDNLVAYVSVHAPGPSWIFPYGTDETPGVCRLPPEQEALYESSQAMAEASEAVDSENYNWLYGNACQVYAPMSGTSTDFAMNASTNSDDVLYAYIAEMRGEHFIIEPEEITVSFEEFLAGIKALHDYMQTHNLN